MKDWETQRDLLFMHDNYRFVNPTPRMLRQPVIERHDVEPPEVIHFWIWLAAAIVLGGAIFGLAMGWIK